ncbi:hypothetical protein BDW59DRAFT_158098 [Aspergillus cavernicola]|uniref:BTB domain-containing protein n=1 Tax=Aspergillus cavernicola TaxID=176166 RepID=A0ABR4ITS2_9EURO
MTESEGKKEIASEAPREQETGNLRACLKSYYSASKFTDLVITTTEKEFKVHKLLICSESQYFARMFNGDWLEAGTSTINQKEDDPRFINTMVDFIASQIADKYDVPNMKKDAKYSFEALIKVCCDMDDFSTAIAETYRTMPMGGKGLRDPLVQITTLHFDQLLKESFLKVFDSTPGFVADLAKHLIHEKVKVDRAVKVFMTWVFGPKEDPHGYVPHSLEANVGDLIVFEFSPRNHSVAQADWKAPCMPADGDYFFSGIKNDFDEVNGQAVGRLPTWNWTPTFFYCTGTDSCIVNGMVGVINPNSSRTWKSQYEAARDAPYMLLPGQPMPAEGETSGGTGTTTISPSTTSTPHAASSTSSHALGAGEIAGIVIGSIAFVIILCVLLFLLGRNNVYKKWVFQSQEGSSNVIRTARWALSTSPASAGPGAGPSVGRGEAGNGFPVSGASPLNGPRAGLGIGSVVGTSTEFSSMEYNSPQSGVYSPPEGVYGLSSPSLVSQVQSQQQQQSPYWIWDQSIQPLQIMGRKEGPSELEGDYHK